MSLSEIQEQEEKNRLAHEEKMKELQAKQRQLQSSASHGWSSEKYVEHIPSPKFLMTFSNITCAHADFSFDHMNFTYGRINLKCGHMNFDMSSHKFHM